jgi:hypothetical protein
MVEAQLEPEVVRLRWLPLFLPTYKLVNADDAEFAKRAKIAELMLKEADIKSNERIAAMQVGAKK